MLARRLLAREDSASKIARFQMNECRVFFSRLDLSQQSIKQGHSIPSLPHLVGSLPHSFPWISTSNIPHVEFGQHLYPCSHGCRVRVGLSLLAGASSNTALIWALPEALCPSFRVSVHPILKVRLLRPGGMGLKSNCTYRATTTPTRADRGALEEFSTLGWSRSCIGSGDGVRGDHA